MDNIQESHNIDHGNHKEDVQQYETELQHKNERISKCTQEITDLRHQLELANSSISETSAGRDKLREDLLVQEQIAAKQTSLCKSLREQLAEVRSAADEQKVAEAASLRAKNQLEQELKRLQQEIATMKSGAASSTDSRVIALEAQANELRSQLANKEKSIVETVCGQLSWKAEVQDLRS